MVPNNRNGAIAALKINDTYMEYVVEMLNSKYQNTEIYDFEDNLQLWIDYIGDPMIIYMVQRRHMILERLF